MHLKTALPLLLLLFPSHVLLSQSRYYKGNTHTHSYPQSSDADVAWTGTAAAAFYKSHGYDFVAFTDHGAWWNAGSLSSAGFLVISGEEAGISKNGRWGHFTALPMTSRVSGSGLTHQQLIDLIAGSGGITFLNHPRYDAIPISAVHVIDSMKQNLAHMEIWNGTTASQAGPDDISVWDSVLATGRMIYGIASDDAHREGHALKGWIMVRSSSLAQDPIVRTIRNGDFYASNGIVFDSIAYSPTALYVKSSNATVVRFFGKGGQVLSTVQAGEARYDIVGDEIYVRAEASNAGNQRGWTQPVMVSPPTGVGSTLDEGGVNNAPGLEIYEPFPNPANPSTTISYAIPVRSHVRIVVFNVLGEVVSELVNGEQEAGYHDVRFDAGRLASGMYLYRLRIGDFVHTRKLVVLR